MVNMRNLVLVAAVMGLVLIGAIFILTSYQSDNTTASVNQTTSVNQNIDLKWYTDLNSAISEAQKTNKSIFVLFSASWCPACQQLESETLTDSRVQQKLAQNYITVKIDSDSNPDLSSQYGIYGIPTIILMDSNGVQIQKLEGYRSPDELLNEL